MTRSRAHELLARLVSLLRVYFRRIPPTDDVRQAIEDAEAELRQDEEGDRGR